MRKWFVYYHAKKFEDTHGVKSNVFVPPHAIHGMISLSIRSRVLCKEIRYRTIPESFD